MAQFKLTNNAVKDLSDIWNYTFDAWSESQADKYYKLIIDACAEISKKPQEGKLYEEIHPNLKGKKPQSTSFSIGYWKINQLKLRESCMKEWI